MNKLTVGGTGVFAVEYRIGSMRSAGRKRFLDDPILDDGEPFVEKAVYSRSARQLTETITHENCQNNDVIRFSAP